MSTPRQVVSTWVAGHRFVATTSTKHAILIDNPGREDGAAASPMDHVLAALGGCAGIDVVNILDKMRQPLERLEVDVRGTRRDEEPKIYRTITMIVRAWGEGLDPEKLTRAVTLSEEKYCSVSAMLAKSATIETRIELNGEPIA